MPTSPDARVPDPRASGPSRRRFLRQAATAAAALTAGCAREEAPYPGREVRLIVHAAPGGLSDTVARYTARGLTTSLGVPVVTENRIGAMGAVAFAVVRRSAPDGYTLGYAPVDLSIIPHMGYTDITAEDFDLLVMHHRAPAVLVVPAAAPWATLDAYLAAARERPRGISLATSGPASVWQIGAFALARRADVSFTYVPFPGTGPAMTALLGGHLDSVIAGVPEVQAVVRAGAVRVLAVMSAERSPIFPESPTFLEHGLDLQFEAWGGFMAPRGLPPERRVLLSEAIREAFQAPEFLQYCRTAGLDLHVLDTPAFEQFMAAESARFSRIVREEGLVRS